MILLKDCLHIVTGWDDEGLGGYDMLIRGNRIERIDRGIIAHETRKEKTETVDARHLVVIPDVGGESTRPGAAPVSVAEIPLRRVEGDRRGSGVRFVPARHG